jgi:hypothetical protein
MPSQKRFSINGLIDTNRTILENIEEITNSAGAWFTFNNVTGLWSVIINRAGTSLASFNDSNIIGGISLNGLGMNELYNAVRVTYHSNDIRDNQDFVQIELPQNQWNANEVPNILDINLPLVNNQVQAQLIGLRDLKQSRVNQVINFQSDYSVIGLEAGDIIDVTSSILGLNQQLYRVTEITEFDDAQQGIYFGITAVVYDADVYDENDLKQFILSNENGLVTAGDIGAPDTPQVSKVEVGARPRLSIEVRVPNGRVEAMEVWMAQDQPTNNYTLVGTLTNTDTNVLSENDELVLDLDNINAANVYVKTRGINSTTAGPFSSVSPLISFVPVQTTDAVPQSAPLVDDLGNLIPGLILSKIAGWALSKAPDWSDVLDDLGLEPDDFTQSNGAPADVSFSQSSQFATAAFTQQQYRLRAGNATLSGFQGTNPASPALTFTFNVSFNGSALQFVCESPFGEADWQYIDSDGTVQTHVNELLYMPTLIRINRNGSQILTATVDWQTQSTVVTITPGQAGGSLSGTWTVEYVLIPTYDLNMTNTFDDNRPTLYFYNLVAERDTRVLLQFFA